jgi:steroid delta-isomerase-like uncharacterized protein
MSEENKAATRRFFEEAFSQGNFDVIDEFVADDAIDHDTQNPHADTRGPEGAKAAITMYREAFPDLRMEVEDIFGDGDHVIARWRGTGTNEGELMGMPPTGKRSEVTGITIDRYENGKLVESWTSWDTLGMLQNLGVIPAPEGATA